MLNRFAFLEGGGEMGELIEEKNWDISPLGNPQTWPQSLYGILGTILLSPFPMFVWWGPELICFYNDAYRPSLGLSGKHPSILGMPGAEAWTEIWPTIKPLIDGVLLDGKPVWMEDQLIPIHRNGRIENVYWTFSYSPILDTDGRRAGVLVICNETTAKVDGLRRLQESNAALKESNERLEFAIETTQLGTWDYNVITEGFSCNNRVMALFGIKTAIHNAELLLACLKPEESNHIQYFLNNAIAVNQCASYNAVHEITNNDTGMQHTLRAQGTLYFNDKNAPQRFIGTLQDITLEINIQRSLKQSEQNFKTMVEQAPIAMCVLTGDQFVVSIVNDKMLELWGKDNDMLLHKPIFEELPEARGQGLEALLNNVYKKGERFVATEMPVDLPRSGSIETCYLNFVYEPLKSGNDTIVGILAVATDVTEYVIIRKKIEESEQRARLAIESADIGTYDFDLLTGKIVCSPRFNQIFGVGSSDQQQHYVNCIYSEDKATRDAAVKVALVSGKLFYEVRIQWPDESIRWIKVMGIVVYNDKRIPLRILGTLLDNTDLKEAEQKREEFLAIASHELRNPLTSIKLSIDLISANPGDYAMCNLLIGRASEQVKRIMIMTNDLLNVSKISAGILDLKPDWFNLDALVQEAIDSFASDGSHTRFIIVDAVRISVYADHFRVEQVLVNLLSNAIKYSPPGSPINIRMEECDAEVEVSVKDSGDGIAPEKIADIFKKFMRVEPTGNAKGFGLGLYISEQIIRKHGGRIGVESKKGAGSRFWFTLPLISKSVGEMPG